MRSAAGLLVVGVVAGLAASCGVEDQAVPAGKLARVGEVVLGPQDLASVGSQLGGYAQLRFTGDEGQRALLEALVAAELLAQEARQRGLGDDPRVRYAELEEIASVYLSSELERAVPYASVASDEAALRAYYDAHRQEFTKPERRSMQGVMVKTLEEGEAALARLEAGEVKLTDLGDPVITRKLPRNDDENPTFHPFLFAEGLGKGDWLERPVMLARTVLVGRYYSVSPPELEPFDDPQVQERLVQAVRAPRLEAAKKALLAELAQRYPEQPVSPK